MILAPMLADFAIRLAFGLAVTILLTSWRSVPLGFFRTQAQVILGLLVLAALDLARAGESRWACGIIVVGAVMAYVSAVAWGLGLPRVGTIASVVVATVTAVWLAAVSRSVGADWSMLNTAARLSSGFLVGTTLTAMLLGHHYLTSPAMSINPLKRVIGLLALSLLARCLLAGLGLWMSRTGTLGLTPYSDVPDAEIFLAARWGMGFAGTAIATYMTWKTAEMRSTQSATGILYIAMIFVLFGELTSMVLEGRMGVPC